jgi:hypothetical protein
MLSFLHKYAKNYKYSQNGEEGVLGECWLRLLEVTKLNFRTVEIGANDGHFCSNTALLVDAGWFGVFVESDWDLYQKCKANYANVSRARVQCARVDENNINAFVDDRCDLLSLDTDGADYRIFIGLKAKPKIVIVEIDSGIPPNVAGVNSDGAAGYLTGVQLGLEKGYFLLCHTGNLVMIANEYRHLFPEIEGDGLSNSELYFKRDWLKEVAA